MLYDQHVSLLLVSIDARDIRVQFTDYLCCILVIFGLIGNILGLCTFSSSRRSWRISTVYVYLATCSSIINLFCAIRYALILHSKSQYILREFVGRIWLACKFYELSFAFRIMSSWITLFWMFERLTCVSTRLRTLFHRWNASKFKFILPFIAIIIILICVIGPPLYMYQPQISGNKSMNSTISTIHDYCGVNSDVPIKWQKYFNDVYIGLNHYTIRCFFSELIPGAAIILINSCIMYHLVQTSHRFHENNDDKKFKERQRTTSWMNVVLILHSSLFLLSILSHIAGHFMAVEAHETWWVLLAILGNCSVNFYLYCLSGQAFRQQIICFMRQMATHTFDKLRICQQRSKQSQHKENDLMYQYDRCANTNQPATSQLKKHQRSIRLNSSDQLSKESSM